MLPVLGSMQPSEITKIGVVVFFAAYLSVHKDELRSFTKGFIKPLMYIAPIIIILVGVQTHLSASIIIIGVASVMMLMAGSRLLHFLTVGVAMARSRYSSTCRNG